jgi:mRNA interferase MazF
VAKRLGRAPKRGEVHLVSFDATVDSEITKTRPAVILQNDISNRWSPITIVAATSSQFDERFYPTEVLVEPPEGGLNTPSVVLLNQVRSMDRQRLKKRLGKLKPETMRKIEAALLVSFGMVEI